jgi:hypothetical protein
MEESPLPLKQLGHEEAQGLRDGQKHQKENGDVQQTDCGHRSSLKLFRAQQRVNQIAEQKQRSDAGDDVIHALALLQTITSLGKGPASNEKQHDN